MKNPTEGKEEREEMGERVSSEKTARGGGGQRGVSRGARNEGEGREKIEEGKNRTKDKYLHFRGNW